MNENAFYIPVGNGTDVSLLKWLQRAEIPVHTLIKNKETQLRANFPFSSDEKYSIAAMEIDGKVRIYLKGAPEEVLKKCAQKFHANGEQVELEETDRHYILGDIFANTFAKKDGLRVIALSYYDMDLETFNSLKQETNNFANPSDFDQLLGFHTFIGLIALKDPLRDGVKRTIDKAIQEGQVTVRLVSADHLETAKCYAVDSGILAKDSYNEFAQEGNAYAMNADEFIEQVGIRQYQDERDQYVIGPENQQRFQQLMDTLVVIGRAKPMHKQVIANGLRVMHKKVAVIGEGINDLKAFENADVSFAMGSGKSIARNRSSMVLTDDNFESCIKAILRGRNIYSNVKKFLQFQITVNFSILVCILISVLYLTESPFNAVMLIWINLIMDVLAALALATAPPLERVISEPAITEGV
jgi:magnesium-transporting ATPase (P-type)